MRTVPLERIHITQIAWPRKKKVCFCGSLTFSTKFTNGFRFLCIRNRNTMILWDGERRETSSMRPSLYVVLCNYSSPVMDYPLCSSALPLVNSAPTAALDYRIRILDYGLL